MAEGHSHSHGGAVCNADHGFNEQAGGSVLTTAVNGGLQFLWRQIKFKAIQTTFISLMVILTYYGYELGLKSVSELAPSVACCWSRCCSRRRRRRRRPGALQLLLRTAALAFAVCGVAASAV